MSVNFAAITPNFYIGEIDIDEYKGVNEIFTLKPEINGRYIKISDSPGWGCDLKENKLKKYLVQKYKIGIVGLGGIGGLLGVLLKNKKYDVSSSKSYYKKYISLNLKSNFYGNLSAKLKTRSNLNDKSDNFYMF